MIYGARQSKPGESVDQAERMGREIAEGRNPVTTGGTRSGGERKRDTNASLCRRRLVRFDGEGGGATPTLRRDRQREGGELHAPCSGRAGK